MKSLFSFKVENGKWKHYISGKTAFYFFSVRGIPKEMFEEMVNKLTPEQKLNIALRDWIKFKKTKEYQDELKKL